MSLLFRLIYAAHANGTHHKLALDALRHLGSPDAERWQRLFLKHAELYLEGAKVPDNEFKDFKNHVLHVRDGYWGGAVDKVESWYLQTVLALKDARWSEAVYAAGILSHYLVDPIHPFHTAQSEAENNIHRAAEWSISKSYADLLHIGEAGPPAIDLTVAEGPSWLRHLVCRSADISNANYERLIAHYDIHRGVVDPPSGLDPIAKAMVGDLIVYAARVHGAVLDRAFIESGAVPPEVDLGVDTVVAALKVPLKWVTKKLTDAADRRLVEAMYDELKATGRVEENLPDDDRAVRDLHKAEVLSRMVGAMEANRARVVGKAAAGLVSTVKAVPPPARAGVRPGPQRSLSAELETVTAAPVISTGRQPSAPPLIPDPTSTIAHSGSSVPVVRPGRPRTTDLLEPQRSSPSVAPAPADKAASIPAPEAAKPAPQTAALISSTPSRADVPQERPQTIYLSATDDLEKAPSIGPKTAERFASLGLRTVADFLNADPAATASRIDARHITAGVIADWQAQARLVMGVPGLRGTHAQLLIGAGLRTVNEIAAMEPDRLAATVLAFAASPDGQRVLRDGTPPDLDRIKSWCKSARSALAA